VLGKEEKVNAASFPDTIDALITVFSNDFDFRIAKAFKGLHQLNPGLILSGLNAFLVAALRVSGKSNRRRRVHCGHCES
jgi:hypothetical protein